MKKRGQTTLFIILGLVIVILVALYFFVAKPYILPVSEQNLRSSLDNIKQDMQNCLQDSAKEPIETIGLQGGYLNPTQDTYKLYSDSKISYLCFNMENDDRCYNRMLLSSTIENEIKKGIEENIDCLQINTFSQPFYVSTPKTPKIDVSIRRDDVKITLDYPVKLISRRTNNAVQEDKFSTTLTYPLGKLYDVSQDIIDSEAQFGMFDTLTYMLSKKGEFVIELKKPYPDKIYILKQKDSDYIFQFAVQGESRFE